MNRLYDLHTFFTSRRVKYMLILYTAVSTVLLLLWTYNSSLIVGNNDAYINHFESFLNNGWYAENIKGTTVIYNSMLSLLYAITNSVNTSFLLLNLISQLLLIYIGLLLLKYFANKKHQLFYYSVVLMFLFRHLMLESYNKASNDTFMAVFVMWALYLFIVKVYDHKEIKRIPLILIGTLVGITVGIRPTSLFLIVLLFFGSIAWSIRHKIHFLPLAKSLLICLVPLIVVVSIVHYPSISHNKTLSFYNKNASDSSLNWYQRNFLAIKNIEENNLALNHGNIWKTKFHDVEAYVEQHGEDSLPKGLLSSISRDPLTYAKITSFDWLRIGGWLLRFSGILLIIPLILFAKYKKHRVENVSLILILSLFLLYTILSYSLIEFRWFLGYEVLIYASILVGLKKLENNEMKWINTILFSSLLLVTLFNMRSIINLL